MDRNRTTAFYIIRDVESRRAYSHIATNNYIWRLKPPTPAFVRELAYGVIRRKLYLDYIIGNFVKTPIQKMDMTDLSLLRMGLYQLIFMNSVPDHAALNETVELAKTYAAGRDGFINAVLRQYLRDRDYVTLPDRAEDEDRYLSVKYSYAPWIVRQIRTDFGADRVESILEAGNMIPSLSLRVNTLRTSRKDLVTRFSNDGYTVTESPHCDNILDVKGDDLLQGRLYESGLYSVQDEGAETVVRMLAPKPGDYVVDVCAAPGGKTMSIAEAMGNIGAIAAIDIYKRKLQQINDQAKRLGISIVETWSWDATRSDPDLVGRADRVLVDAPCSGLGTVRKKPEIKYKGWNGEIENLPRLQHDILSASSAYVKPGGVLVYSTCTILKRENDAVIKEFLRRHKDFLKVDTKLMMTDTDGTDGFYMCKMTRKELLV
ncbi:MAG: 16S rRNA (cytosine(967)-C(5))-methyltransferase RsmB [Clostridiales Family XIII bacterium]|jgi:16S rRNA (cytosine967-C5)-methyltransferase|nr:16S rRNA (cytosine(967)-C(5))-methyltransferase RsmB [Clostridiales Family XIII bacterium]